MSRPTVKSKIPIGNTVILNKDRIKLLQSPVESEKMENSTGKGFVTLSQPLKKRTLSESKESELSWHIEMEDIATSLAPLVVENIRESVTNKINESLETLNNNLNAQLGNIVQKLDSIQRKNTDIDVKLNNLSDKVEDVKTEQQTLAAKIDNMEQKHNQQTDEIKDLKMRIQELEINKSSFNDEIGQIRENLTQPVLVNQMVNEMREQMNQLLEESQAKVQQRLNEMVERKEMEMETGTDASETICLQNESRLEGLEQYARRDCLKFFGLVEEREENTTLKVVETAAAMGLDISVDEVSISHRLQTRNRQYGEPRPIIAKFVRRTTKQMVYSAKHKLKFSDNHFSVYIREHLTQERARAVYHLKKKGYSVYTDESRLNYSKDNEKGVINALIELHTKLNWDKQQMLKVFNK